MTKRGKLFCLVANGLIAVLCLFWAMFFSFALASADARTTESAEDAQITVLDTRKRSEWSILVDGGSALNNGRLSTTSEGHDFNTSVSHTNPITTDAALFSFQTYGTMSEDENLNTMWTVRAQLGQGGGFDQFTGYHIVLNPNKGTVLCITNPDIAEYGIATVDLKGILFDGEVHQVVVGATDRADGVYVFLDVDGANVWNYLDPLKEGQPRIAKDNTTFCVGHRNIVGGVCEQVNSYIFTPDQGASVTDPANITSIGMSTEDWTVVGEGTSVADGALTASDVGHDWNSSSYYNHPITTDAFQFMFRSYGTLSENENANTVWSVRAQAEGSGSFDQYTGYHIVLYPNTGRILCITNPDIAECADTGTGMVDLKQILFDGEEHTVLLGAIDRADGVYVFLDVDGKNIWSFTDPLKDGAPRIAKAGTAFTVGHRNLAGDFCEQVNYVLTAVAQQPEVSEPTVGPLDTNEDNWTVAVGGGTTVSDGTLTASSDGHDWNSAAYYNSPIETDAVQFTFQSYGTMAEDVNVNTVWTVRAELGKGGSFDQFTGYHIVLNPNKGTVLCITNPDIAEYGVSTVDLKSILFDGKVHTVVVGAADRADGVYVFMDVDGENVWNYLDPLKDGQPRIAKDNTSFAVGHRNIVPAFCEQLNYYINPGEEEEPPQTEPPVIDPEDITDLDTETDADWTVAGEGTTVSGGMLTASDSGHDWNSSSYYNKAITTDAIRFRFQTYGTLSDNADANTMWTVRAQLGKSGAFSHFTGYHIVLYPNRGRIVCITNPDIDERGDTGEGAVDLKKILFDGTEHTVVIGAVDTENGVYVFLDVDGENIWNYLDPLKEGQPRVAKENTSFCVGHRDIVGNFCEQINYYINYTEFQFPEYTVYDLQESDFSKNNWELYQNIAVADGALVSNSGETHAMAKYLGLNYSGEDAIRFQLKIASITNQISFCLRAERDGGEMYWNAKMISVQINLTNYSIIFNHSGKEADVRNPQNGSLVTPLKPNQTYLVEVGAVDTEDGVMVFLLIDEELQFVYTDTAEDALQVVKGNDDTFKIGSFDKSQFVVTAVGAEDKGKDATRSDAELADTLITNENWANILNAYNPDLVKEGEDALVLQNKGGVAYADSLRVTQIDFDFQFDDTDSTVMFMFNKSRRGTYFDSSLQQVEYQINMCYAISLSANGSIYVQKSSQSAYSSVDTLKAVWGAPFGNDKHHLTILFSVDEDTNLATIEIFIDHALDGYKATDPACSESYRQGFIGIQKMGYGGTFTLSDLRYTGEVIDTTEGKNTDVKNVYLAQFYDRDKHDFEGYEGKNILRWSYTKDSDYVKSVAVKVDGVTVKEVVYPVNIVEIADQYVGKEAQIVLATIDGTYSTLNVMLTDERDEYAVEAERYGDRIAIRENTVTGYAEFYYNDGTTPADQSRRYMPVGSNYLLLKDSWEPSTFDASPNVLLNNYDPLEVEAMLALLAKNNYNALRVFLSGITTDSIGGFGGVFTGELDDSQFYMVDGKQALYLPYMNNLTDFLARCQKYGVYVLVVLGASLPATEYFDEYRAGLVSTNAYILDEQFIQGKEEYAKVFLNYIKEYDAANGTKLMNAIFAVSNDNESSYSARTWPFNLEGEVTLANGKTYDMTDKEDRQRAADEGKIYFYERFVAAVKGVDPQLLTCEGMFTLLAVGNYSDSDPEANYGLTPISDLSDAFPTTLDVMMQTDLDFFDVHIYHTTGKELVPAFGENMRSLKYNDAVKAGQAKKPIIMAEFGAFRSKAPTFEEAKEIIVEQRDIALGEGYHFQGFITWQLNEFKQTELYAMLEDDAKFLEGELRYVYLERAELVTDSAKLAYKTGEQVDFSGVQIRCFYSDGTQELIPATQAIFWNEEDVDMSVAGSKRVELLFEEQMILAYEIAVEQAPVDPGDDDPSDPDPSKPDPSKPDPTDPEPVGGCGGLIGNIALQATVFGVISLSVALGMVLNRKRKEK